VLVECDEKQQEIAALRVMTIDGFSSSAEVFLCRVFVRVLQSKCPTIWSEGGGIFGYGLTGTSDLAHVPKQ